MYIQPSSLNLNVTVTNSLSWVVWLKFDWRAFTQLPVAKMQANPWYLSAIIDHLYIFGASKRITSMPLSKNTSTHVLTRQSELMVVGIYHVPPNRRWWSTYWLRSPSGMVYEVSHVRSILHSAGWEPLSGRFMREEGRQTSRCGSGSLGGSGLKLPKDLLVNFETPNWHANFPGTEWSDSVPNFPWPQWFAMGFAWVGLKVFDQAPPDEAERLMIPSWFVWTLQAGCVRKKIRMSMWPEIHAPSLCFMAVNQRLVHVLMFIHSLWAQSTTTTMSFFHIMVMDTFPIV